MKRFVISILFCSLFFAETFGQKSKNTMTVDTRLNVEFMVVPALMYNSVSLGLSRNTTSRIEQALTASAFAIFVGFPAYQSASLRYNYNFLLTQRKKFSTYIPFWTGARYLYTFESAEGEGPSSENIFYSVGSGYGMKVIFKNQSKLRIEAGAGAALNTSSTYKTGKGSFVIHDQPFLPSLHLNVRYMIPLGKQ